MAVNSHAIIHTVEPSKHFGEVARQLFKHAGLSSRVTVHQGTLHCVEELIKKHGQFDFVMVDHVKEIYLQDFKEMERLGAIRQGTTVFADNVIFPGSSDYLHHM
jgi:predicted O-methyltransferase YrrM